MDNTGAMLKGASEIPHKSEPPDLEDVEEEAEVRETYREDLVPSQRIQKSCMLNDHKMKLDMSLTVHKI